MTRLFRDFVLMKPNSQNSFEILQTKNQRMRLIKLKKKMFNYRSMRVSIKIFLVSVSNKNFFKFSMVFNLFIYLFFYLFFSVQPFETKKKYLKKKSSMMCVLITVYTQDRFQQNDKWK